MTPRTTSLILVAIVVLSTVAFAGTAAATAKRSAVTGVAPGIVYQGETLDVSGAGRTTGGSIGTGSATFVGVAGDADGVVEGVSNTQNVDFEFWETGGYDVDNDNRIDLSVIEPRITEIELRLANGADVTNRRAPSDEPVTVRPRFNFGAAADVQLSVIDPQGLDVAPAVASTQSIQTSGGTATLDFSSMDTGTYRVVVESEDLDVTREVTITIGSRNPTIALDKTTVSQGERVRATVTGAAGSTVTVRIRATDLDGLGATNAAAQQVFESTGDVQSRQGNSAANVVYATVRLGDNGIARLAIRTQYLQADRTVSIRVATGTDPTTAAIDDVDLRVTERTVSIRSAPSTVTIGERFTVSGGAPQSDTVKAYARVGDNWVPLFRDAAGSRYAEIDVESDGSYELEVSSSRVIHIPGSYRVGVASNARSQYGEGQSLTLSQFNGLTTATTTIQTGSTGLTATLSQPHVARDVGDEVTLSGTAPGQSTLHLYVVSPRGQLAVAESVSVRDGTYERDIDTFPDAGTYRVLVMSPGRNGAFKNSNTPATVRSRVGTNRLQAEAVDVIRDAYSGAGVDDQIVERTLVARNAEIRINAVGENNQVQQRAVTVTGTSNRQDRTLIEVDLIGSDTQVLLSAEARVDGRTGTWSTPIDLADRPTGTYTLRATDGDVTTTVTLRVVAEPDPTASVRFRDQDSAGDRVTVASVTLSHGGFVAIHRGSPTGPVIGHSDYLPVGTHTDVAVTLDDPITTRTTLVAMAHQDSNTNREYEFPNGDGPYLADGGPVVSSGRVSITATPTPTATASPTPTATPTGTASPTQTPTPGQPGFTAIGAALAVLFAAWVARRRRR